MEPTRLLASYFGDYALALVPANTGVAALLFKKVQQSFQFVESCSLDRLPSREWSYMDLTSSEHSEEISKVNSLLQRHCAPVNQPVSSVRIPIESVPPEMLHPLKVKNIGVLANAITGSITQNFYSCSSPSSLAQSQKIGSMRSPPEVLSASTITSLVQMIDQKMQDDLSSSVLQQDFDSLYKTMLHLIGEDFQFPSSLIQDIWLPFKNLESISIRVANTNELKFAFIKTYLLYTELAWFQPWHHTQQPTFKTNKDIILSTKNRLLKELPKEVRFKDGKLVSTVDVKFYLQCIEQAAQCLNLENTSIWKEYTEKVKNQGNFHQIYQFLFSNVKSIAIESWYVSAWKLHWLSANLTTLEAFKSKIEPEIKHCLEQGNEYTISLATVFMEIFKNPNTNDELKERAFLGLKELVALEHEKGWLDLMNYPEEVWNRIIGQADRFGETRYLIMEYLLELANQEKGLPYREKSRHILLKRSQEVNSSQSSQVKEEQLFFKRKLNSLQEEVNSIIETREGLEDECAILQGETRSSKDDERLKEVVNKIKELDDQEIEKNKECEKVEKIIDQIEVLAKKEDKEKKMLQDIQQFLLPDN